MAISNDSNYIVVVSNTQAVPIIVAERLLKFSYQMIQVRSPADVLSLPEDSGSLRLVIVELTEDTDEEQTLELLKAIQVVQPKVPFIFTCDGTTDVNPEYKNHITNLDVVYFPFEVDLLVSKVLEIAPVDIPKEILTLDAVAEVQLPTLKDLDTLPFDVFIFLPLNKKAILYKKIGQSGFYSDLSRMKSTRKMPIYVRRTDFPLYSKYMAKYVSQFESLESMPEDIRMDVTRKRFTEVIRGFVGKCKFDNKEEAQEALASARKVTLDFVKVNAKDPVWMDRIQLLIGRELNNYNHAMNVSAYCVMFGLICGLDDVDSLALGGLFHDIGMSHLPPEIATKEFEQLNTDEIMIWEEHPEIGLEILEKRGITLSYEVQEMIRNHHDVTSATDEMVFGSAAKKYAQICAFADIFDELTSVRSGQSRFTPLDAINKIAGLDGGLPNPIFASELHMPIVMEFLGVDDDPIEVSPEVETKNER